MKSVMAFNTCHVLDRVTGIKWTDLIERYFIDMKVIAPLRNKPTLLPPARLAYSENHYTATATLRAPILAYSENHYTATATLRAPIYYWGPLRLMKTGPCSMVHK